MRQAINRSLSGARLQGVRHGPLRKTVPIKRSKVEELVGKPEYPAETFYTVRQDDIYGKSANIEPKQEGDVL